MTHKRRGVLLYLLSLLLAFGLTAPAAMAADSLLPNGDFETDTNADGKPDDWPLPEGASIEQEEGNHFLRLTPPGPEKILTVYRVVKVEPEHKAYAVTFRARATDLVRGKANWHDGRIILDFKDADGKKLKGGSHPNFKGTTKDGWTEKRVELLVPEGATRLEVMPALFNVKSGTLDIDDLKVEVIDPQPVIEARKAAAAKKAADIAKRAARVKPQVPPATEDQMPPELRVVGNELQTSDGKTVWLQGIAIPSMGWSAGGENILESIRVAIDDWNVNCIRLAVKEHFWEGTGPWQNDGGAGYRQLIEDSVNLCAANGVYLVIDLHRFRAPEQKHADFWGEVAEKYKNHPAVLFEVFNEPHDVSWDVWRDGGPVTDKKKVEDARKKGVPIAENDEKLMKFRSVGMQGLVDAVRETGANNIIIAGGLDWSYDLSGVLNGYALDDKGGNGIVYSTHVYPWKSGWDKAFLQVAEKYPLFLGEVGATQDPMPFIPIERHEDPYTFVPDLLGMIQQHKLNWTGWSFHPKASPCLLSDWDYTPTPYWGAFAKKALSGEQFEMTKKR